MRRLRPTILPRFLLAAAVALASFGPGVTYTHSHPIVEDGHHDHAVHHYDHAHDDGPELTNSVAHVHGSWLGLAITFVASDGPSASDSSLAWSACPTLSSDLEKWLTGPLKERVPWPDVFVPPEHPFLSELLASLALNPHVSGARTSCALAGRTLVLRC